LGKTLIPCDFYYAGLEGAWKLEGQNQEVDITAEVYVGRAPVDTPEEANNFVEKNIRYYRNKAGYHRNVLMAGEDLAKEGEPFDGSANSYFDGLANDLINKEAGYQIEKLYDILYGYSVYKWTADFLINGKILINGNYIHGFNEDYHHLIIHFGHSSPKHNLRLESQQIPNITNINPFIILPMHTPEVCENTI